MLSKMATPMPHRTAGTSSERWLFLRYAMLMATIRNAFEPFPKGDDERLQHALGNLPPAP